MAQTKVRKEQIDLLAVLAAMYPVGSIYTNASVSTNPATLLGFGTWTAFGAGKVMVGLDSGDTDFDTAEETGGAKTHTLTSAEMPSHTHTQNSHNHSQNAHGHRARYVAAVGSGGNHLPSSSGSLWKAANTWIENSTATNIAATATNQNTGGDGAHNNVQPYIVVYLWKRTA